MPQLLKKLSWFFSEYKWYRKWYGGSWCLWYPKICTDNVWFPEDYIPGCCFYILKKEEYPNGL